ncbi:hypothetical protein [Nocardiopsis sp. NPDC057823]|uniref:hypothetical protein n=1 Tax=Nocardiopsis sp. NPDC057823 TaxID=3346256 RepID=UPI003673423A
MPSTLSIAEIAQTAQVTRADVIRVIRGGGTTQADWHIARTIEQLGGRRAADLMWGPERIPTETPTETNPHASYDPEVRIYAEPTAPDAPQAALPDHLHDDGEVDPLEVREAQAATVHADLVDLTDEPDTAERIYRRWASPIDAVHQDARRTVQQLLLSHPRTRRRAVHRARQARHLALAA